MKTKLKDFQSIYKEALKECGLPDIQNRNQCLILTKSYQKPKTKRTFTDSQELQIGHIRNYSSQSKKGQQYGKISLCQKKYSLNNLKGSNGYGRLASLHQISQQNINSNTLTLDQKLIKISAQVSLSARQNTKNSELKEKLEILQKHNSKGLKNKKVGLNSFKSNWKQWQKQQIQDINDFVQFVNNNKGRQSKNMFYKKE